MLPSVIGGPGGCLGFITDRGLVPVSALVPLIILNLSSAIAVRAVLTIIYPATAITMWTNLHCQHLFMLSIDRDRRNGSPTSLRRRVDERGDTLAMCGALEVRLHVQTPVAAPGADHTRPKPQQFGVVAVVVSTERYLMAACRVEAPYVELVHAELTHAAERHRWVSTLLRSGCHRADALLICFGAFTRDLFKRLY